MTDRKLLELAAKAAKIEIETGIYFYDAGFAVTGTAMYWNPILSNADALVLAVTLKMLVETNESLCVAHFKDTHLNEYVKATLVECSDPHARFDQIPDFIQIEERHNSDPIAATRRAIVRAAAEIGKSMEVTK